VIESHRCCREGAGKGDEESGAPDKIDMQWQDTTNERNKEDRPTHAAEDGDDADKTARDKKEQEPE
jgi:hypothetical protein